MSKTKRASLLFIATAVIITGCGGGSSLAAEGSDSKETAQQPTTNKTLPQQTTVAPQVTSVRIESLAQVKQTNVPVTFGQVFAEGDVDTNTTIMGQSADGQPIPLQLDAKATHADGSLRHGIITAVIADLASGEAAQIRLVKAEKSSSRLSQTDPTELLEAGFTARVDILLNRENYYASADELLKSGKHTNWLAGPIVNEWLVSAPLKTAAGVEHPHLTARFAIRAYNGMKKARVDVTIENNWAYEPGPQNFTYDVDVMIGNRNVYSLAGLTHFHHARWRKTFWWGTEPKIHIAHDKHYLIQTKAVPNYDRTLIISENGLAALDKRWTAANTAPMAPGIVLTAMPTAGGRGDIGPMPQWAALYLLSMDPRAKKITLGTADLAGSWPIHYRDKDTDLPVSLDKYPYMTLLGRPGDTVNKVTKKSEAFPACGGDCTTAPFNYNPDSSHQPSLAYLPYLVSGDHFALEELHFWANYNMLKDNPYYRGFEKGLVKSDQVRGQAWSLRTLGHAAYITPDNHPLKGYFTKKVEANLDWYNGVYTRNLSNRLGIIDGKDGFQAIAYTTPDGPQTGIAPWMDDFYTWSVGHLWELGFTNALPLVEFKTSFAVARMKTSGYCWIDGAVYALSVRSSATAPLYESIDQAYSATMRSGDGSALVNSSGTTYLSTQCGSQQQADWRTLYDADKLVKRSPWVIGEMTGYATSPRGYPSNMQPALSFAVNVKVPGGPEAWKRFIERPVKPDYSSDPEWAIVPRY